MARRYDNSYRERDDRYDRDGRSRGYYDDVYDRGHSYRTSEAGGDSGRSRRRRMPHRMRGQQGVIDWVGDVLKIVLVIVVILFCISMSHQAYQVGYNIFHQESVDPEGEGHDVEITITAGMSVDQIGQMLEENGLLKDGSLFRYQERFSSWHGKIVPGTYTLSTDMTPDDMLKVLSANYQDESSTESTESSAEESSGSTAADTESATVQ